MHMWIGDYFYSVFTALPGGPPTAPPTVPPRNQWTSSSDPANDPFSATPGDTTASLIGSADDPFFPKRFVVTCLYIRISHHLYLHINVRE